MLKADETSQRFWAWVDERAIVRRISLVAAIAMTWHASQWAMSFAEMSERPGMDVAAIIAAVTAPAMAFGGYIFKWYVEGRAYDRSD